MESIRSHSALPPNRSIALSSRAVGGEWAGVVRIPASLLLLTLCTIYVPPGADRHFAAITCAAAEMHLCQF